MVRFVKNPNLISFPTELEVLEQSLNGVPQLAFSSSNTRPSKPDLNASHSSIQVGKIETPGHVWWQFQWEKKSAQLGRSHHSFHRQSFPGSTKIWLLSPTSDIKNTFLLKCSLFRKHGHSLIFFLECIFKPQKKCGHQHSWSQLILVGAWEASWTLINDGGTNVTGWKPIEMFGLRTSRARCV